MFFLSLVSSPPRPLPQAIDTIILAGHQCGLKYVQTSLHLAYEHLVKTKFTNIEFIQLIA
jgi:hypothetical protein